MRIALEREDLRLSGASIISGDPRAIVESAADTLSVKTQGGPTMALSMDLV